MSTLYKKHFKAVAEIILNVEELHHPLGPKYQIALKLADYFKTLNYNFDRRKFLEACGYET